MLLLHRATYNAFSENTYIIYNERSDCWIVDPGMNSAEERATFIAFIAQQGLTPVGIINTHAHIDHIFGVEAVMHAYDIPFALHPLEAPVLAGARGAAMMFGFTFGAIPKVTEDLKEGSLALGDDEVEVRLVPGHSPGSVVFYYAAGGWAIAGDTLFGGSVGRTDLPGGHHETLITAIRSQLLTLPDSTVIYPGHGPETTIGAERKGNPYL